MSRAGLATYPGDRETDARRPAGRQRRPEGGRRRGRAGVARADPGADRPRPAVGVAMAFAAAAPGRLRRARRGDARALRRQPGRYRDARAAAAGRAGGGAAAAGGPVPDAGLADRLAGAAAGPAGTCRLVGRLAVGRGADTRAAGGVLPGRYPPAAGGAVVDVGADPHPVVAVAGRGP